MARLQQKRVGFKQMRSFEKPGKRVKSLLIKKGNQKVRLRKKIIDKEKAVKFISTLKERDKMIFELLLREIETKKDLALADIFALVRLELKNKNNFQISSNIIESIYKKASKFGVISLSN